MCENILEYETVSLDDENNALVIIDQTLLPNKIEILSLTEQKDMWNAIYLLQVRGAPAIGVAAAIAVYLAAKQIKASTYGEFYKQFTEAKIYLSKARPTAVNLFWALDRMEKVITENSEKSVDEIKILLKNEAKKIKNEDIDICKKIGEHGLTLIKDGDGILTHCNAGQLATAKYGTALSPIHLGRERGCRFKVFACETRPLLQGARLTAFELYSNGIDVTLICDNMASHVMKSGRIQAIFVGCDRVAANGDVCNKIGTSGVAILAKHYDIPFYVCAPTSTIDLNTPTGDEIHIEERPSAEITEMWFKQPITPKDVKTYNPAFDITDNKLITAIITEHGIIRAPFFENLRESRKKI
ncbi:MAG: S-methyl-5-thioribose-1-phosphate isomerase [Clostridiales bacterium]|jgi:methylthioribose-1-phosphate isomerase|nr:S-methyl-5-thioribose-1-phosphate isomerase [Clostridiales bacterium]